MSNLIKQFIFLTLSAPLVFSGDIYPDFSLMKYKLKKPQSVRDHGLTIQGHSRSSLVVRLYIYILINV